MQETEPTATKFAEKQVGYTATSVLLNETHEFLRLVINSVREDIIGRHESHQCLALSFVSSLVVTYYILPAIRGSASLASPALSIFAWIGFVIGAATLAFSVLGLSVLIRSTRAFGSAATAARAAWDRQED